MKEVLAENGKISDSRFYFYCSVVVVILAVITLLVLSNAKLPEGQLANIMTLIVGFSVIVTSNYKKQSSLDLATAEAKLTGMQAQLEEERDKRKKRRAGYLEDDDTPEKIEPEINPDEEPNK